MNIQMDIKKDKVFRLFMIDGDAISIVDAKDLYPLVQLFETKGYIPIPAEDSIVRAMKTDSIAVIFPAFKEEDDESINLRAIEMFDEIIFRNKFKDTMFKLVDYKGYKLIIDSDNIVVRYTSREKEIKIGKEIENIKVLKENLSYEEAFKTMQENMIEALENNNRGV